MDKYEIIISWSEEDAAYVADIAEPPGCIGNSHEEAPGKGSGAACSGSAHAAPGRAPGIALPSPRGIAANRRGWMRRWMRF